MDDQQQPQQQIEQREDEEEDINQFIELLNSEQVCDPRFKYLRHRSKFQLKNLEKSKCRKFQRDRGIRKKISNFSLKNILVFLRQYGQKWEILGDPPQKNYLACFF